MKSLEYFVHWIIYEILLLFCVAPVFLLPLELHGRLFEGQPVGLVMKGFVGFLVLACFLGTPWLAHNAARRRVLEGEGPFEALANVATAAAVEGRSRFRIRAPLVEMSKADIVHKGLELGVPFEITHSCYDPVGNLACGRCDACRLRAKGFREADVPDPTRYVADTP